MIQKIKDLLIKNSNIKEYKSGLKADLNSQAATLMLVGGIVVSVAWLGFAFKTDPVLHPEFKELLYFRLGLSVVGIMMIIWSFIPSLKAKSRYMIIFATFYALAACGFFTGRLADDPNYVSGYQLVIMIVVLAPIMFKEFFILLILSFLFFLGGVYIYSPDLKGAAIEYSMNNLVITYVFSLTFAYFIQRFRISLLVQNINLTKLKEKQDGDYFLTSNLIKPLFKNDNKKAEVKTEFFTSQYKKFHFKKWNAEIGGDYSTAHNINLKGREYTVFVNADAMGKSIQGAGGVLVFGTVFKSIISRTQKSSEMSNKYPEQWLKICFIELQDIFTAFDGSMLMSAIIGLVDTASGLFYFINSEHPGAVLYRDNKASFIDDAALLRKIGIEDFSTGIQIQVFALRNEDIVILGSDGRDDILLSYDEEGRRIINEDENLFLKNVEKADGDLQSIYKEIRKCGEITDDFTLLKVQYFARDKYNGDFGKISDSFASIEKEIKEKNFSRSFELLMNLLEENNVTQELLKRLYQLSVKMKKEESVYEHLVSFANAYPANRDVLYYVSYVSKILFQKYRKKEYLNNAIDFGERFRLRKKEDSRNLINLANVYILSGNFERADKLLQEAKKIDPGNENITTLKAILEKKS